VAAAGAVLHAAAHPLAFAGRRHLPLALLVRRRRSLAHRLLLLLLANCWCCCLLAREAADERKRLLTVPHSTINPTNSHCTHTALGAAGASACCTADCNALARRSSLCSSVPGVCGSAFGGGRSYMCARALYTCAKKFAIRCSHIVALEL
jgi:hypothetical protein